MNSATALWISSSVCPDLCLTGVFPECTLQHISTSGHFHGIQHKTLSIKTFLFSYETGTIKVLWIHCTHWLNSHKKTVRTILLLSSSHLRWKKKFLQEVSNLPKLITVKAGFECRHSDSKAHSLTHWLCIHCFSGTTLTRPVFGIFYILVCVGCIGSIQHIPGWSQILRCFYFLRHNIFTGRLAVIWIAKDGIHWPMNLSLKALVLRTEKHVYKSSLLSLSTTIGLLFICTHILAGTH